MYIQNPVAVVGDHRPSLAILVFHAPIGVPAELDQLACHITSGHRDDFHRQREFTKHLNQLGGIGDADEFIRGRRHNFFLRERRAAALDHGQMTGHFVGAIDIDGEWPGVVERPHVDATGLESGGRCLRAGNGGLDAVARLDQLVDEKIDGRTGADADNDVVRNIGHGGFGRRCFEGVLVRFCAHLRRIANFLLHCGVRP